MPAPTSMAYPNAVRVVMDILKPLVPAGRVRTAVPASFEPPLIVVRRIGGGPNANDDTDQPVIMVSYYHENYLAADDLSNAGEVAILSSPCTEVNGVLVDEAEIYVGDIELPDVYPDERRINASYRFGFRRQFRP